MVFLACFGFLVVFWSLSLSVIAFISCRFLAFHRFSFLHSPTIVSPWLFMGRHHGGFNMAGLCFLGSHSFLFLVSGLSPFHLEALNGSNSSQTMRVLVPTLTLVGLAGLAVKYGDNGSLSACIGWVRLDLVHFGLHRLGSVSSSFTCT